MKLIKKPELIPSWRKAWRLWSVRLNAIGLVITGCFFVDPNILLFFFNSLPDDIRNLLPANGMLVTAIVIYSAAILVRVVKQKSVEDE